MSRARECGTKRRHSSRASVIEHQKELQRAGARRSTYAVYRCSVCDGWHVGHRRRRRR